MNAKLKAALFAAKANNEDDKRGPMSKHKTYKMFGNKIEKDVSRTLNDDGTYTRKKTKLISYKGNPVTLKEKERVMIDEPGNIETIVSNKVKKTSFLGDGDTQVKIKEQNYPTNMKMYLEDKAYREEEEKKKKKNK